tara:strand:+ start:979 stop:2319 length:1341 start_codon:yes stop_codon:yes gene_type:complete
MAQWPLRQEALSLLDRKAAYFFKTLVVMVDSGLDEKQEEFVQRLVNTNCKGYGEYRLTILDTKVLLELVRRFAQPCETEPLPADIEAQVALVLAVKKEALRKARAMRPKKTAPEVHKTCRTAATTTAAAMPPTPFTNTTTRIVRPLFAIQHEISIVAFNSLKLRIDHKDLQDDWIGAAREFATHDVLVLSEVRASDKLYKERVLKLLDMLNGVGQGEWTHAISEPCGPGVPEIHALFVKKPIQITAVDTLHTIDGLSMDHAPIVATIEDQRFMGELRKVNIVGVHFPPLGNRERRTARNAQIARLLSQYPGQAKLRLNQPFGNKGSRETKRANDYVCHIVCGDFNADSHELRDLGADANGWDIQLGSVRTSCGGKAYDNFLVSRDAKDHTTLGTKVMDLTQYANFSRREQGLSDHAPIVLRVTEVPRTAPTGSRCAVFEPLAPLTA